MSGVVAVTTGLLQASYTDGSNQVGRDVDTGGPIFLDDLVSTGRGVKSQIMLKDHSVFTIGENSKIVFDSFVYDPGSKTGELSVDISQGVFRFISGKIASNSPEKMKVNVGGATIGVRGTAVAGRVTPNGTDLVLLSGEIDVTTAQGAQEIIKPGWGVTVSPFGEVSPPAPVPEAQLETLMTDLSTSEGETSDETEAEAGQTATEEASAEEETTEEEAAEATRQDEADEAGIGEGEAEDVTETAADEPAETTPEANNETAAQASITDGEVGDGETASEEARTAAVIEPQKPAETQTSDEVAQAEVEPTAARAPAPAVPSVAPQAEATPTPNEPVIVTNEPPATAVSNVPSLSVAVAPVAEREVETPKTSVFDQVVLRTLAARAAAVVTSTPQAPVIAAPTISTEVIAAVIDVTEDPQADLEEAAVEAEVETVPVAEPIETETIAEEVTGNQSRERTVVTIREERSAKIPETSEEEDVSPPVAEESETDTPTVRTPTLTAVRGAFDAVGENSDTSVAIEIGQVNTDEADGSVVYELSGDDAQYFEVTDGGRVRLRANTALNYEQVARYDITIAARNEAGDSARQAFEIEISDENDAPVITTVTPPGSQQDAVFTYVLGASDEDIGDELQFSADSLPSWLSLGSNSNGETILTGTPGNADVGSETITLKVSDGTTDDEASFTINIANVNDAPTLSAFSGIAFQDTDGDDSFANTTGTANGSDIDVGDILTYGVENGVATNLSGYTKQVAGDYGTFYLNEGNGSYQYVPDDEAIEGLKTATSESFDVSVMDGSNASATGTVTISVTGVNDIPTLASLSGISFTDTQDADSFTASTGTANGSDADIGETLTYGIDGGVATNLSGYSKELAGTYGTFYVNETTGAYQYVPNGDAIESLKGDANEKFDVWVSDGDGGVTQGEITVNVTGANDVPTLASLAAIVFSDTADDDSFASPTATAVGSDLDDEANTLTYGIDGGVASSLAGYNRKLAGSYGTLHINESSGAYTFVPDDAEIEALSADTSEDFDITVADNGGANTSATITVNINAVNDAPRSLSISNNRIPNNVAYAGQDVTSDNLLTNPDLSNGGQRWSGTNFCQNDSKCGQINNGVMQTGSDPTELKQTINVASFLQLADDVAAQGGVLSWSTEVWMNTDLCSDGKNDAACEDKAYVAVQADAADGTELVRHIDERSQKADWETWSQSENVSEMPTTVTYSMSGSDYADWGCCDNGPAFRNPNLTYTYTVYDDVVIGSLSADDPEAASLSYSVNSDSSGLFEIRGNQLILKAGSTIQQSGDNAYTLMIDVTDADGATSSLPLAISAYDVGNTETQINQILTSDEDAGFTFEADFGAGETVTAADLPSWLSLTDLSNGRVRLTGTAPHSGNVLFSLTSTKDGKKTTSHYAMEVDESCSGAYCTSFVSSDDTENLLAFSLQGGDRYVGDTKFHLFPSWDDMHDQLSTGTATYERTDIAMNSLRGGGNWTGNMRYEIDYGNRTVDSTLWGTFSGYGNNVGSNAAGSFLSEDAMSFAKANSDCYSTIGGCTTNINPTTQYTCTGTSGSCTENNHESVGASPTGFVQVLTNLGGLRAAIGEMSMHDSQANGVEVADTDTLLLDPQ